VRLEGLGKLKNSKTLSYSVAKEEVMTMCGKLETIGQESPGPIPT
jgi:hypothetical protein